MHHNPSPVRAHRLSAPKPLRSDGERREGRDQVERNEAEHDGAGAFGYTPDAEQALY
jgi:hypothetical protein